MKKCFRYIPCAFLPLMLLFVVPAVAQENNTAKLRKEKKVYPPVNQHNEMRIGWGDMMFETLVWH